MHSEQEEAKMKEVEEKAEEDDYEV